ncbi:er associated chaperone [Niveomyces insectorum RCEF 264]|uniref:Er associated chaperone n=1 Tax=Niveomyces insectorum RCEF 264 TaxID=1081102 RepID=A0A167NRN9_9HYPO|nr:er associated chaperone [Niveomyces insectorum RCEF 264]
MPSATASGADAANNDAKARHREHNQGNQERKCTPEQAAAVLRIRRCQATAFYEILEVERTAADGEIKKAYRKQSLLTHPDKNGHKHADEAFKMVSRAFGVLGDKDKRAKYDRFGTDPDSRFGGGGGGGGGGDGGGGGMHNPFARARGGGGDPWGEEMSPEEMFRQFFGGGGFGPFGGFDTGPQFVFNMGGGPGIRVHQFGGARPRTRPRNTAAGGQDPRQQQQDQNAGVLSTFISLLPVLILFVLPLLSSLFSGGGEDYGSVGSMPKMVFDAPVPPYTVGRQTAGKSAEYFVRPEDLKVLEATPHKLAQLDNYAGVMLVRATQMQCEAELKHKQALEDAARGWLFQDPEKMEVANSYETKACKRLDALNKKKKW